MLSTRFLGFASVLPVLALLAAGCGPGALNQAGYRPSLTDVRTGKVEVDDDPVIPEDLYVPGIVINYEDEESYLNAPMLLLSDAQLQNLDELDDPAPLEKHKDYAYETTGGDLFDGEESDITFDDVRQGAIADCYFAGALSAVLYSDHDHAIRNGIIRAITNASGDPKRYVVRFYDYRGDPQDIEVDADLVRSGSGTPTYIRSADSDKGNEEWAISLIEKAYAEWRGGFEEIGNGGYAGDVMQALTGSHASYRGVQSLSDTSLYDTIREAVDNHRPVASGTFGEDSGVNYEGTGVYAWHVYTVLDVRKAEDGQVFVKLRNPWGNTEPAGNGEDDGIFEMATTDFRRLYSSLHVGSSATSDTTAPAAPDDLAVVETLDGGLILEFSATGDDGQSGLATRYDVRLSTSPITTTSFYQAQLISVASPQSPDTQERIELSGLENGKTYYVAVRVEDESGNVSAMSDAVSGIPAASVATSGSLVSFDFEDGASDWTTTGLFHLTTAWASSPSHSYLFADSELKTYDVGHAQGTLRSPTIALPAGGGLKLRWTHRLQTEMSAEYDKAWVVIVNASGNETTVWTKADGHSDGVLETPEVSLDAFAGQQVNVVFSFDSVDDYDNNYFGWFIDDVAVDQ